MTSHADKLDCDEGPGQVIAAEVTIRNPLGLHARPAMAFVDSANGFTADVRVLKDEESVDGKSIMHMMLLNAAEGTKLRIEAVGEDAEQAITTLAELIQRPSDDPEDDPKKDS